MMNCLAARLGRGRGGEGGGRGEQVRQTDRQTDCYILIQFHVILCDKHFSSHDYVWDV